MLGTVAPSYLSWYNPQSIRDLNQVRVYLVTFYKYACLEPTWNQKFLRNQYISVISANCISFRKHRHINSSRGTKKFYTNVEHLPWNCLHVLQLQLDQIFLQFKWWVVMETGGKKGRGLHSWNQLGNLSMPRNGLNSHGGLAACIASGLQISRNDDLFSL